MLYELSVTVTYSYIDIQLQIFSPSENFNPTHSVKFSFSQTHGVFCCLFVCLEFHKTCKRFGWPKLQVGVGCSHAVPSIPGKFCIVTIATGGSGGPTRKLLMQQYTTPIHGHVSHPN